MRLTISKSKNSISYYVNEAYRNAKGVSTSRVYENLGTHAELQLKLGADVDVEQWCRDYVDKLNKKLKLDKSVQISIKINPDKRIEKNVKRTFDIGNIFLQKQLDKLNFSQLCKEIRKKHKFKYNFQQIFADLICTRILAPTSKLSSYQYAKEHFLQKPEYELEDVYRVLDVIAENDELIQSFLFDSTVAPSAEVKRNTDVLFYDCTNFFFESNDEGELRRFGKSKENKPNPIVQMGLFMDGSGIPLGFSLFPGNQNEQPSLKPLEKRIIKDFELHDSKMIICTDAGLASTANRRFNSIVNRDFITVASIKKMPQSLQNWVLDRGRSLVNEPIKSDENREKILNEFDNNGWRIAGDNSNQVFSLDDIDETDISNINKIFYKERYIVDEKTNFEQRLIVTYSLKYKAFLKHKRDNDILRAQKLINTHNSKKLQISGNHDIRQYIKTEQVDKNGIIIDDLTCLYKLDDKTIAEQSKYDGFYAVCTSLSPKDKSVDEIIKINKGRWEIEESFRIMKTEFKSRPVYVSTDKHIIAHFNVCFVALLVFRLLEHTLLQHSNEHYTVSQIVDTLRSFKISPVGTYYTSTFMRTDLTDLFHEISALDVYFDCEYISPASIRKAIKNYLK